MFVWERPNAELLPGADYLNEILTYVEQLFKLYTHVYQIHDHNSHYTYNVGKNTIKIGLTIIYLAY